MFNEFEIKCKKCNNNIAVNICVTITHFDNIRDNFVCLACGYEAEVTVIQNNCTQFENGLDYKL